jgi:aryl-alcohol dehydrogenase-like predicted oxidoreductase
MIYRQLGTSELEVPVIIFGAWAIGGSWWGGTDDDLAVEAIRAAVDAGVTCIDTAPVYGCGHSEEVVGKAIKGLGDRVTIATKCGLVWETADPENSISRSLKKDSILRECDASLRRLGVDHLDLYQCHWPDESTPLGETMEALVKLQDAGKIRAIGLSNHSAEAFEECLTYGPVQSNQPKFSLLDRRNLDGVIRWTHEHAIGSIVYSPLEQGVLTGKVTPGRKFAEGDNRVNQRWFKAENLPRALDVLHRDIQPIADAHDATLGQIALAWTIAAPGITSAIVGARNAEQAASNAKAADVTLSDEERATILAAFEALD